LQLEMVILLHGCLIHAVPLADLPWLLGPIATASKLHPMLSHRPISPDKYNLSHWGLF